MKAGSHAAALMARMPRSSSPMRRTRTSLAAIIAVLAASMRSASHLHACACSIGPGLYTLPLIF